MYDLQKYPLNLCLIKDYIYILIYILGSLVPQKTVSVLHTNMDCTVYSVHFIPKSPVTQFSDSKLRISTLSQCVKWYSYESYMPLYNV